tara:strand:+ start:121 stop:1353 length:1233 start_codon:yes stop_codon:yes gene_type:complete
VCHFGVYLNQVIRKKNQKKNKGETKMKALNVKQRKDRPGVYVIDTRRIGINTPTYGNYATKAEAEKEAKELLAKFTLGMVVKEEVKDIKVKDAFDQFMVYQDKRKLNNEIGKSFYTDVKSNLKVVLNYKIDGKLFENHFFGALVKPTNQSDLVQSFKKHFLDENKSKATMEKRLKHLKSFLNFCNLKRFIDYNPMNKFTFGKSTDISDRSVRIQPEIIQKIIKVGLSKESMQVKTMVLLAAASGMRQGELRAIKWSEVDFDSNQVKIVGAIKHGTLIIGEPKTKRGKRIIPVDDQTMAILKEWKMKSKYSKSSDLVFPNTIGTVMLGKYFEPIMKRICEAAGVDQLKWGDFRHFFASTQLSGLGEDWAEVAALMGHATPNFTYQQYGHYVKNEAKQEKARSASAAAMYGN